MPLYDYECASGHRVEKLVGRDRPKTLPCDVCGAVAERQPGITHTRISGVIPHNDYDDPWEGTVLAGQGEPSPQQKAAWERKPVFDMAA